jgi:hypothetical protein
MGPTDAWAALNASSENGTAVLADAVDSDPAVASIVARMVPLKTLRVSTIVSSIFDPASQTTVNQA